MNLMRTATIVVAGGAVAAWLALAATSNVRDDATPQVALPSTDARGAELAGEIARLHERLRPTASPRTPGRDLFRFGAPKPKPVPAAARAALSEPSTPAVPPPPPFKLSGVAEDPGRDGPDRTAVIAAPGQLFLVKEGEPVTPRYRVLHIAADVVELVDVDTNVPLRLAMRP